MREGHRKITRLSIAVVSALIAVSAAYAQDGSGRSESVARPAAPAARRKIERVPARAVVPAPTIRRVELGRLALAVNEGGSRVQISRVGQPDAASVIPVPASSSSLIVRTLPSGHYRIEVSKPGYADEIREVEVVDGKRQRVSVYLKPKMAVLSVGVSVNDARIEIERVGAYDSAVNKLLLKPGRYTVKVSRRGYVPQSVAVELNYPGREQNLQVLLKPLRIDEVLDDAAEKLEQGDDASARALAGDVLQLNVSHARANLLFGMARMRQGDQEGIRNVLKAIRNGETFRTRVRVQEAQSIQLHDGEVAVDVRGISFKSSARFDLNFTILRKDVSELIFSPDPLPGFISLAGKSDFHGRPIAPDLKLHPHDIVASGDSGPTRCAVPNCQADIAMIARILLAWRVESASSN